MLWAGLNERHAVLNRYLPIRALHQMEITFDPVYVAFVCQPEGATEPLTVPARGLTKVDLMGDLAWMMALLAYQLAFPFSPDTTPPYLVSKHIRDRSCYQPLFHRLPIEIVSTNAGWRFFLQGFYTFRPSTSRDGKTQTVVLKELCIRNREIVGSISLVEQALYYIAGVTIGLNTKRRSIMSCWISPLAI